jgi:non-specific serine/threonine protein kinase
MPRQEVAVLAARGRVWVFGGFESGRIVANVRVYDPARDQWEEGPSLPLALHHTAVAAVGEDLYVLGGMTGLDFRPFAESWVLRAGATEWAPIAPMPAPRGAAGAGFVGGRVVVVGGVTSGGRVAAVTWLYDPRANTWREGAPLPTAREHLAVAVSGGSLWTFGGRLLSLTTNLPTVEVYDPATDRWRSAPPLPTPRGGLCAAFLGDTAVVIGGEEPARALTTVEGLDLPAGLWRALPALPTPRHGHGCASLGGRLYLVGGADRPIFAPVTAVDVYTP